MWLNETQCMKSEIKRKLKIQINSVSPNKQMSTPLEIDHHSFPLSTWRSLHGTPMSLAHLKTEDMLDCPSKLNLMLVGVGWCGRFLGSEVVLTPFDSLCLPSCWGWVLLGVAAFMGSEVVLTAFDSLWLPSNGGVLVGVAAFRGSEVVLAPFDAFWLS